MLRNFLGILAQKVCDVRHELFLIRDARDMFQETDKTLQVFTAGVAIGVTKEAIQRWNLKHPELQAEMHPGGSVDLIRQVLAGERCDDTRLASRASTTRSSMASLWMAFLTCSSKEVTVSRGLSRKLTPATAF